MSIANGRAGALLVPGLELAQADVAEHLAAVAHRFGPAALGVLDLPVLETSGVVGPQVRVCGVLYWAFELEQAGLVPFVEALAEGIVRGTLILPIGAAATPLVTWWRGREYRFGAPERAHPTSLAILAPHCRLQVRGGQRSVAVDREQRRMQRGVANLPAAQHAA